MLTESSRRITGERGDTEYVFDISVTGIDKFLWGLRLVPINAEQTFSLTSSAILNQLWRNPTSQLFKLEELDTNLMACRAAKSRFYARGEAISSWAERHGFSKDLVYSVLAGRTKGHRGQAHKIAIALGLKVDPLASAEVPATTQGKGA